MKNKFLILFILMTSQISFSQDFIDEVAKDACECLKTFEDDWGIDRLQVELTSCYFKAAKPFKTSLKRDYGIDLNNIEAHLFEIGKLFTFQMIEHCPEEIAKIKKVMEAEEKDKKDLQNFYLKEDFDKNERGWIEENTSQHFLEIENGMYHIVCKDSASIRTSAMSLDNSYLFNLPNQYSLVSKIYFDTTELDTAHCGILLYGATIGYQFHIPQMGQIEVFEHHLVNDNWKYFQLDNPHIVQNLDEFTIEIKVNHWDFQLYINEKYIGNGKMECKTWFEIRPYVSSLSSIKVDYMYIK